MIGGVIINYEGLWKILLERKMRKQDLKMKAGLTHELIAKLGRGESVHLDALLKICKVLDCELNDIMEVKFIREEN